MPEKSLEIRIQELEEENSFLRQRCLKLEAHNDQLIKAQAFKDDLTNMLIHDLKGPLSEIQANLEILSSELVEEFQTELLDAAKIGAHEILRMISNLLDMSRWEQSEVILRPETFDPVSQVRDVVARHQSMAQLKNISLSTSSPPGMPFLNADPNLFNRILINLLSNALDFTPEGGQVTVKIFLHGLDLNIFVEDTGPGVPVELQEKIFEKYIQGRPGDARTSSGLGLAFCKLAVEAHGGRIWMENKPDRGSRFIILFPRRLLTQTGDQPLE